MRKDKRHITDNLLKLRQKHRESNSEFADRVGVPIDTLRNVLNGHNNPSLDTLILLSDKLKISMDDLCTEGAIKST